jgi:hypothetical protein
LAYLPLKRGGRRAFARRVGINGVFNRNNCRYFEL